MFDNIFQLRGVVIQHLEDITRLTGGCKKISPIEIAYREEEFIFWGENSRSIDDSSQ